MRAVFASLMIVMGLIATAARGSTPATFQLRQATTVSGTALAAVTGYNAAFTSSVDAIEVQWPVLSDGSSVLRAVAIAEPASEIAFLTGLASIAAVTRRRSRHPFGRAAQREGQRTNG